jgi:nitroreductase
MELLNALKWRYATKKMNGQAVSQDNVNAILEAAHLAPSSSGLQPFEIIPVYHPLNNAKDVYKILYYS